MASDNKSPESGFRPIGFVRSGKITIVLNEEGAKVLASLLDGGEDQTDAENTFLDSLGLDIKKQLAFFAQNRARFQPSHSAGS